MPGDQPTCSPGLWNINTTFESPHDAFELGYALLLYALGFTVKSLVESDIESCSDIGHFILVTRPKDYRPNSE